MSNLELKTKNLEEHYSVIRSNVQQASQELTLKLEEKLNVEKELGQLRNQIIFEKGQYEQEVVKTRKLFSLLEQQRQDLDKRKHDLVLDERMHSVAISEAKEVKNNLVNETHKVEIEINELNKQKVKLIDELAEYEGLTKQKIELLKELSDVNAKINSKKDDLDNINTQIRESRDIGYKELSQLQDRVEDANIKLEKAIRAVDPIKDNIQKQEQELASKQRNLQILINRVRKLYQELGQDFKL